jgi:hypothetical protein
MNARIEGTHTSFFCTYPPMTSSYRWLYSLFIAIDANFRLKLKTRGIKDPELGSGLAYFVNTEKFEAHLKSRADEEEVSSPNSSLPLDGELTPR